MNLQAAITIQFYIPSNLNDLRRADPWLGLVPPRHQNCWPSQRTRAASILSSTFRQSIALLVFNPNAMLI
jgi:hypothetical protein